MTNTAQLAAKFAIRYPEVVTWIGENFERNEFALSLAGYIEKHGTLTDAQIAAVKRRLSSPAAPVVDASVIEAKFAIARANQVRKPAIRLDSFVFKYAGDTGRNPGAIYVTEQDAYLGKIAGGKFQRTRECSEEVEARIVAAASNPDEAAKAYGQRTGCCSICGRPLTAEESIDRFVGPICAQKWGIR